MAKGKSTLQKMDRIQAKANKKLLLAIGWGQTSARALLHGPMEMGGFNTSHLYSLQVVQK